MANKNSKDKLPKITWIFIILFIILFISFVLRRCNKNGDNKKIESILKDTIEIDKRKKDYSYKDDKKRVDSLIFRKKNIDEKNLKKKLKKSKKFEPNIKKSKKKDSINIYKDTSKIHINKMLDTIKIDTDIILKDTIGPYVYIIPPEGMYYKKVNIKILTIEKKTKIFYLLLKGFHIPKELTFKQYEYERITIDTNSTIIFFAIDSVNNSSDTITYKYYISLYNPCPNEMVYVEDKKICIDKYEWPNKEGEEPKGFISLYEAMDLCASVGKRLCYEDEWISACEGIEHYKYGYKGGYNFRKCNTQTFMISKSGQFKECRSFWGAYDMIGNLSEWVITRDGSFRAFGGNFRSASIATCRFGKRSYFPENKYSTVGFRCCKDIR